MAAAALAEALAQNTAVLREQAAAAATQAAAEAAEEKAAALQALRTLLEREHAAALAATVARMEQERTEQSLWLDLLECPLMVQKNVRRNLHRVLLYILHAL